jgi:hypothetical protein
MKVITAVTGQTLFDISIQEMGSVEGVFDILNSNPFLRLDMAIPAGTKVLVPDTVLQPNIVDYYTRNNIKPASGLGEQVTINEEAMINITQPVNYALSGGDKEFEGVRLWNLRELLTVQIDYTGVEETAVEIFVEQSLDGVDYSPIEEGSVVLDYEETTHTFNIYDLVTNFCRVRVETASADGSIDEIIWRI